MSTTSLYQKYRPDSFTKVIGQDPIITTISNQIESDKVGHAYLFYGTRGLGKTTIARLMAEKLDITAEDLYEIDAASNRGIDDVREIRAGVQSRPFSSPYKMYLIDEVHMLTKEAFNALLKTLEEPPEFVIFVLATTELHKVPDTIKSRTQLFTFSPPGPVELQKLLESVAKEEGFEINDEALSSIIQRADGSYRDALTQLQQYASNPKDYRLIIDNSDLIQNFLTLLSEISNNPETKITPEIATSMIEHPDIQALYQSLVSAVSDTLFQKITDNSQSKIKASQLQVLLSVKDYFADNQNQVLMKAGIVLLLSNLKRPI